MGTLDQTQTIPIKSAGEKTAVILIVSIIIAWAFFLSNWNFSFSDGGMISADQVVENVGSGSMGRKVAYGTIGLMGICLIFISRSTDNNYHHVAIFLFCAYMLVCASSVLWSQAPELTVRRLIIFFFCVLAIIGVLRHLSLEELLYVTLVVSLVHIGVGILVEIVYQSFNPFGSDYRFAGTFHPNSMGSVCSALVMASFCMARDGGKRHILFWILMAAGLSLLFLTKSRSAFFSCCLALLVILVLRSSFNGKMLLLFTLPTLLGLSLLLPQLFQLNTSNPIETALYLGRDIASTEMISFNGRLPLWKTLGSYIYEAPWLGYGYHGFWTANRIFDFYHDFQWMIPNAHSVVIDLILNVGLIGAVFYLSAMFLSVLTLTSRCMDIDRPETNFAIGITMIALVGALFESGFADPTDFVPFLSYTLLIQALIQNQPKDFSKKVPS